MPVIAEEEYKRRWAAVQDLMGRRNLDLILAYADDRVIFGSTSTASLAKDMVISVDIPMFNTPWGGLRVEDGFVITDLGAERLNQTPYKIQK